MTLLEFNQLSFDDKMYCIVDNAVFIDNYIDDNVRLNCYALFNFFVELIYNSNANKISKINAFQDGKALDKYLNGFNTIV